MRSVITFFLSPRLLIQEVFPIWAFAVIQLGYYWPFARASLQELLGWSYSSMNMGVAFQASLLVAVMGFVVAFDARSDSHLVASS